MTRRFEAVVFDFGGVLITSISNQIGEVAESHGTDSAVMHEVLLGPTQSGADHPWHRAERGELALDDIQDHLAPWAAAAGLTLQGDEIDRLLRPGGYSVVGAMVERVGELRQDGHRTGLLTNTFAEFRPILERDIDLSLFDAVIESYAVGARKPEPAIYHAAAEMLGTDHSAIVYLDDFEQNLAAASDLGWTTVLVRDHGVALDELARVLDGTSGTSGYERK